jgi:tetratricopeptide (TPR) repeat protein
VQEALASARTELEQARQGDAPADRLAAAWGHYGDVLFVHELLAQARVAYAAARSLQPADASWPYLQALVELSADDPKAAAGFLDQALALAPDDLPALLRRGRIRLEANDPQGARQDFERALALSPAAPAALGGLGRLALAAGNHEEARDYFQRALEIDPAASQLQHSLGMAYRGLGNVEQARHHLGLRGNRPEVIHDPLFSAVRAKSRSPQFYVETGLDLAAAGHLEEAARAMAEALALDPEHEPALFNAGDILARLGNLPAAHARFERLLELDPDNGNAWFYLGQLDELQGRADQAASHYRRALAIDAGRADARLALADLLFSRGDFAPATVEYQALWDSDAPAPDRMLYGQFLALSHAAAGDCKRAMSVAEQALEGAAAPPADLAMTLARLRLTCDQAAARQREAGLELAERLYEQIPGQDSAETLALAYAATGRFSEAVELQMQAIFEALKAGALPGRPDLRRRLEQYERNEAPREAYMPEHPLFSARKLAP